jgi:hypothetical protein
MLPSEKRREFYPKKWRNSLGAAPNPPMEEGGGDTLQPEPIIRFRLLHRNIDVAQ